MPASLWGLGDNTRTVSGNQEKLILEKVKFGFYNKEAPRQNGFKQNRSRFLSQRAIKVMGSSHSETRIFFTSMPHFPLQHWSNLLVLS